MLSTEIDDNARMNASTTIVRKDILFIDAFVSEAWCADILEGLDSAFWQPSLTYQRQANGTYRDVLTKFRISETAHQQWFNPGLQMKLAQIEKRLARLFDVKTAYLEPWQATDYPLNGKFDYHLDAGYWDDHRAGDRIRTFLLYLTTPAKGGGTHFRAQDIFVDAKAGRLLVWENLFPNGDCNHRMIHSSVPLRRGEKTTLVTWQRQKKFRDSSSVQHKGGK